MNKKKLPIINKRKNAIALSLMAALPMIYVVDNTPFLPNALGVYHQFRNEIYLRNDLNRDARLHNEYTNLEDYVSEHEFAHFVWWKRRSEEARKIYCRSYKNTGYSPTDYGKTNCAENYAEIYAGLKEGVLEYEKSRYAHRTVLNDIQRWEDLDDVVDFIINY